jgi:potassium/hydrogen antiporter
MPTAILITICILILIAYAFDLSSKHTKIPTVILLLVLGWILHVFVDFFGIQMPNLNDALPILGTVGLILIVLEGGLELDINSDKTKVLISSSLSAFIPLVVLLFSIGYAIQYYSGASWVDSLVNAIPFCIISSAIAIPTVQNLGKDRREFVIYESSLSDIFGVIIFNFMVTNATINWASVTDFFLETFLAYLIRRIDHSVKFVPIIMMVVLIYVISKEYHLPALIFILIFGLFLNNLDELKRFKFIQKLGPEALEDEVHRFREIVGEFAFLIRTMFFILFGFLIDIQKLLDPTSLLFAFGIVASILVVRVIQLKLARMPLIPLLFIAPRGLITILLFISIPLARQIPIINESLMIQVIVLSALAMMIGLLFKKKEL